MKKRWGGIKVAEGGEEGPVGILRAWKRDGKVKQGPVKCSKGVKERREGIET